MVSTSVLALLASAVPLTLANYTLTKDYSGAAFFESFTFFTSEDPSHGFSEYVDESTANSSGLAGYVNTGKNPYAAFLGVDTTNVTPNGRPALRILAKETYNHMLLIADFHHIPFGAGVWPAVWLLGTSSLWPAAGEIDIIEGVNSQSSNRMTLHTNAGITLANATMIGEVVTTDCNVAATSNNQGCAVIDPDSIPSFGANFNKNHGGVFATEYTSEAIKIWFFPRGDSIPDDISGGTPDPSGWGIPNALFENAGDDGLDAHFCDLRIILNTDFCGDWAGNAEVWAADPASAYADTCIDLVQNSPQAFTEAYWAVNFLKVFQDPRLGLGSKKRSASRRRGGAVLPA